MSHTIGHPAGTGASGEAGASTTPVLMQPHGFLIACDVGTSVVEFASSNAVGFLLADGQNPLGRLLGELIEDRIDDLWPQLLALPAGPPVSVDMRFKGGAAARCLDDVVVHRTGGVVVIEALVPHAEAIDPEREAVAERAAGEITRLLAPGRMDQLVDAFALAVRRLSGYQRVMVYRFLPDWCGEVIAESCDEALGPRFLGLRFPASDVPERARALSHGNPVRIIADVGAQPAELLALRPGRRLDLDRSQLRQPSSMQLKYLENMGVRGCMTLPLVRDGGLWGLVVCHHPEPRVLRARPRAMLQLLCALVAQVPAARIEAMARQEDAARSNALAAASELLASHHAASQDLAGAVQESLAALAEAMNTQAHGLLLAGAWVCEPAVDPELVEFLLARTDALALGEDLITHRLALDASADSPWRQRWAGVMVLRVPGVEDSYLFLMRQVEAVQVAWAGEPVESAEAMADGLPAQGPRASFQPWREQLDGQCAPWEAAVVAAAQTMATRIGEIELARRNTQMQDRLTLLGFCIEHLNDMVVVTDAGSVDPPGQRIVFVNQAFVDRTGYSREEVLGKSPRMLQGPATERPQLDALRAAMLAWEPVTVELTNYTKGGEEFWIELSLTPIADATGWYTHWIAIERDISERRRAQLEIEQLAHFDPLTGLPNRRTLKERLESALLTCQRHNRNGALLFIDLDNFKTLNDTAGHHMGDELLKQVAQRLVALLRPEDMVARLGGDEFVVLLEDLSLQPADAADQAQRVAQKIVEGLRRVYTIEGTAYNTTASVGVSLLGGEDEFGSVGELLKQSDFAMYEAKAAGRNAWRFYNPTSQATVMERNALEADLRMALARNQMETHYQVIVDADCVVTGVEALLRWCHPVHGWVSPSVFIPIAERSGQILPIGRWVLQTACELLVAWADSPERSRWSVAVNVSARQVAEADFVADVTQIVQRSGCNPALLKLELTESLLQRDVGDAVAKMKSLRTLGLEFSIDDFGTGYSSLAYLRRLPVSVLKIDGSFVRGIEQDDGGRAICKTVLALGQTLNMGIVAEGVETAEQFEFLQANGCDRFQGYLFARPVPLEQLSALVQVPAGAGVAVAPPA